MALRSGSKVDIAGAPSLSSRVSLLESDVRYLKALTRNDAGNDVRLLFKRSVRERLGLEPRLGVPDEYRQKILDEIRAALDKFQRRIAKVGAK